MRSAGNTESSPNMGGGREEKRSVRNVREMLVVVREEELRSAAIQH